MNMNRTFIALVLFALTVLGSPAAADSNLVLEGTLATGQSNASALRGDLAYVVGGGYFNILDVGNPQNILPISSTELAGNGAGLIVDGDLVYVMEGNEGVSIFGVLDPTAPVLLGRASTSGSARSGVLAGYLLYVAAQGGGLDVVDVLDPTAPFVAGGLAATPDFDFYDVAVQDGWAYVMSVRTEWDISFPNLLVLTLGNPYAPATVATHEYPMAAGIGDILVHDSVIYMADGAQSLHSASFTQQSGLVPLGSLNCPANAIAVDANGVLFASDVHEFASVDISQPGAMSVISTLATPRWGANFDIDGGRTFLPQSDHGALLLDLSVPSQMVELAHYWPPGDATGLTYRDGQLFVAGQQTWVVDTTDPKNMKSVAENGTGVWDWVAHPNGHGVAYAGGIGVRAFDTTTGATLGTVRPDGQTLDVSFWNTTVYSAQSISGFAILDFSDPTAPAQIGGFDGHQIGKIAAYGDVLYTTGSALIEAFDVSDPTAPVSTFSAPYTDFIGDMVVEGGRLFVCSGDDGVFLFGLEDPLAPTHLATLPAQTRCYDVAVHGLMMAVAEPDHGAFLYDISDPSAPELVGSCSRPGRVDEVALTDDTLFLNVDGEGVYAYSISDVVTASPSWSGSTAYLRATANPARGIAEFAFGTAWPDDVQLAIYDLAGRRVRSYRQPTRPGQPSWVIWDGRDDASRGVASGVYLVRLKTSRSTLTDKITFMR